MPFNISQFKSTMNKYGGAVRKNLYVVDIIPKNLSNNNGMSTRDLRFFCQSASVPGINFGVADYFPNGFGVRQTVPMSVNLDNFNSVFMLDSDHMVLRFFHQWMQSIINYNYSDGAFSQIDDQLPYEIGYKEDYACTIVIKHYSTDFIDKNSETEGFYEYVLHDAFPTQISGVDVSWSDNDSYATATINFAYSHMSMSGNVTGRPTDRFARGTGFLDLINRTGTIGQVINQGRLPTSVQDAINSFTSVKTTISGVKGDIAQIKSGLRNLRNIF